MLRTMVICERLLCVMISRYKENEIRLIRDMKA